MGAGESASDKDHDLISGPPRVAKRDNRVFPRPSLVRCLIRFDCPTFAAFAAFTA